MKAWLRRLVVIESDAVNDPRCTSEVCGPFRHQVFEVVGGQVRWLKIPIPRRLAVWLDGGERWQLPGNWHTN